MTGISAVHALERIEWRREPGAVTALGHGATDVPNLLGPRALAADPIGIGQSGAHLFSTPIVREVRRLSGHRIA